MLLAPGDTVMSVPWKVLQNQQSWQPHSFDLIGLAGQTFAVYFNVINDGVGGRTAMCVDDARLWACSGGANPPPMPVAVPLPAAAPVVVVPLPWRAGLARGRGDPRTHARGSPCAGRRGRACRDDARRERHAQSP